MHVFVFIRAPITILSRHCIEHEEWTRQRPACSSEGSKHYTLNQIRYSKLFFFFPFNDFFLAPLFPFWDCEISPSWQDPPSGPGGIPSPQGKLLKGLWGTRHSDRPLERDLPLENLLLWAEVEAGGWKEPVLIFLTGHIGPWMLLLNPTLLWPVQVTASQSLAACGLECGL